jgi:hypothetical protein
MGEERRKREPRQQAASPICQEGGYKMAKRKERQRRQRTSSAVKNILVRQTFFLLNLVLVVLGVVRHRAMGYGETTAHGSPFDARTAR